MDLLIFIFGRISSSSSTSFAPQSIEELICYRRTIIFSIVLATLTCKMIKHCIAALASHSIKIRAILAETAMTSHSIKHCISHERVSPHHVTQFLQISRSSARWHHLSISVAHVPHHVHHGIIKVHTTSHSKSHSSRSWRHHHWIIWTEVIIHPHPTKVHVIIHHCHHFHLITHSTAHPSTHHCHHSHLLHHHGIKVATRSSTGRMHTVHFIIHHHHTTHSIHGITHVHVASIG